jgi:hypothetical protein
MSESEWLACEDPDLMLELVEGVISREQLVEFVRRCWGRVAPHLPSVRSDVTVVEQFAALAPDQSDHDAALYASEAALKAVGWAPLIQEERRHQAALLRQLVGPLPDARAGVSPVSPCGRAKLLPRQSAASTQSRAGSVA